MNWEFMANTAAEMARVRQSLPDRAPPKIAYELLQMANLLEGLASAAMLDFPMSVAHQGETAVPDFRLDSNGCSIGVEVAMVAVGDVEHARALQQKNSLGTLSISSLYRKRTRPRRKAEVIAEGFLTPAEVFPVSVDEHDRIWAESVKCELEDKTAILAGADFNHGNNDWLVLWDRVGTSDWKVDQRRNTMIQLLVGYWNPGWFSHVFLQDTYFNWLMVFTAQQNLLLRGTRT